MLGKWSVDQNEHISFVSRQDKITKLYQVIGCETSQQSTGITNFDAYYPDPDETYELTIDNVKKILAIHMRFR